MLHTVSDVARSSILFLILFVSCAAHKVPKGQDYKLLIISFDGFRWNYLQRTDTPNFNHFMKDGVHARYGIRNAFVTNTFPNHFTLVTGLWEESHGIVDNEMFDPLLNETFAPWFPKTLNDPAWFNVGAEPIWVTNQLQKEDGRSGNIMWLGGGAPIKWVWPSRYMPFDENVKDHKKVDTLIEWFTDEYPINLGLMYFMQPDADGHDFGPESEEVTKRIAQLDETVGYLLKRLKKKGLLEDMNIIITSDHGFSSTPLDKVINLDDFIDPSSYMMQGQSPVAHIWPHKGKLEEIFSNLTKAAEKKSNFTVYKKESVPDFFHYSNNRRMSPILVVAEDHFSFVSAHDPSTMLGDHGYDNRNQDMHPFFMAMGPSFKKGYSVDTFDSVDIYPLMCRLLQLTPAPNNGSLDTVGKLLLEDVETSATTLATYIFGSVVVVCVASIFIFGVCRYSRYLSSLKRYRYSSLSPQTRQINSPPGLPMRQNAGKTKTATISLPLVSDDDDDT